MIYLRAVGILAMLLVQTAVNAQKPVLVKDIFLGNEGSNADSRIITADNIMFFVANDGIHGEELWKSDGTEQGTQLVADIAVPDPNGMYRSIILYSSLGDIALFMLDDGIHGRELWRSDGTTQGTYLLKDIQPGKNSSWFNFNSFVKVRDKVFFFASGYLWLTDGTVNGTRQVTHVNGANEFSDPSRMLSFNDLLYFSANGKNTGYELWRSDGTANGTYIVKDIWSGRGSSYLSNIAIMNGSLYFSANDSLNGQELWKSDGTTSGTQLLKDINTGNGGSGINAFATIGNTLFFAASDPQYGIELWKSDGTTNGTMLVKDLLTGNNSSSPTDFISMNGKLYFSARELSNGMEIWESDGTEAGTKVHPYFNKSNLKPFETFGILVFQNKFYLNANDSVHGWELWSSDGTFSGTNLVKDINPGISSGGGVLPIAFKGSLYFWAYDGFNGSEIWKSDGTENGTKMLKNINVNGSGAEISDMTVSGNLLYFSANDHVHGNELWVSNGSESGTRMLKDIASATSVFDVEEMVDVSGTLYFSAGVTENSITIWQLWKTDGTEAGTVKIRTFDYPPSYLTASAGKLYFVSYGSSGILEVWKSDGTTLGTKVIGANTGGQSTHARMLTDANGVLFFVVKNALTEESVLWRTDGTIAGTQSMKTTDGDIDNMTNLNGNMIYTISSFGQDEGLWISPGKFGSTEMIKSQGSAFSNPSDLKSIDGYLYFNANTSLNGDELWRSDATESGTKMVKDIFPGMKSGSPGLLTESDSGFYFFAIYNEEVMDIWKSDGNSAKTSLVKRLDHLYYNISAACVRNNLYFSWSDTTGTNGLELWTSDGTAAGTHMLDDLYKGPFSSNPQFLTPMNGSLYFVATSAAKGTELWKLDQSSVIKDIRAEGQRQLTLYPNPASGQLYIPHEPGEQEVKIIDIKGQEVYAKRNPGESIDVSQLAPGIYIVSLAGNGHTKSGKLVVIK